MLQHSAGKRKVPVTVNGDVVTLTVDSSDPGVSYFDTNPGPNDYVAFDLKAARVYQVAGYDSGADTMTVTAAPSELLIGGGKAYGVNAITYSVTTSDGVLRQNATGTNDPLAGDGVTTIVEDLQFAYQVAGDAGWYNDPATDFPAGSSEADIEMVRINITVSTAVEDATVADAGAAARFNQPPLEDHTDPGTLNGPDGFRRRVYTTVVKVRNL